MLVIVDTRKGNMTQGWIEKKWMRRAWMFMGVGARRKNAVERMTMSETATYGKCKNTGNNKSVVQASPNSKICGRDEGKQDLVSV